MAIDPRYIMDPRASVFFAPQDRGGGVESMGSGNGYGWLDWSKVPGLERFAYQPSATVSGGGDEDIAAALEAMGYRIYDEQLGEGRYNRGIVDQQNQLVGDLQELDFGSDRGFFNAGLAMMGGALLGPGGVLNSLPSNALTVPLAETTGMLPEGMSLANVGAAAEGAAAGGAAAGGGLGSLSTMGGMSAAELGVLGPAAAIGPGVGPAAAAASWIPGISNSSLLFGGLQLGNALLGNLAANKAVKAQTGAAEASNALLDKWMTQSRADNQPLLDMRNSVLPKIQGLINDPSSVANDPGYQFGLNQGNRLLGNRASASGNYYSGQQLKAAQQFGQDFAGTKLNDSINRLMGVAGLGQVGANNNQSVGGQVASGMGNNLMGAGNARASGYVSNANNWGNALGSTWNNWQMEDLIRRLPGMGG